ncbi:MAG: hypothetical protein ROZ37_04205 [Aromatoleum sp.]|jgi:hypothetical protein|uniref:hypothetical protein n=1 Tax=Aromatoleum sp. TaxID=2307007 RepID=UPI0028956BBA|nr:hypothetical protein [Aromatoleum sp.]MDT3669522.1 hypothetical protein [Aromatoleum sp.]
MKLPQTIDDHIAARRRDIADCRALRGAATLRQLEGDKNAPNEIDALEREIAEHERAIARLEDAKNAAAAQQTEEGLEDRRQAVKAAAATVTRLDAEIDNVAEQMLEHLEALAPLVAQIDAAFGERRNAMWSGFRSGVGSAQAMRRFDGIDNMHTESSVAAALQSALFNTGLGRGRLTMQHVHIGRGVAYTLEDMRTRLAKVRDKVRGALEVSRAAIDPQELAQ